MHRTEENDENGLIINWQEAKVVQTIYEKYLQGYSILGLQRLLKEHGIPSPSGKDTWNKKYIDHILTNEKYTGDVVVLKTKWSLNKRHKRISNTDGKRYMMMDTFPVIISKDMFIAVKEERARRSNIEHDESGTHRKKQKYSAKSDAQTSRKLFPTIQTVEMSHKLLPTT